MSNLEHRIRVDVVTNFVEEQSNPGDGRFVSAYTITIRNEGSLPARLLSCHWVITDANGKVQEVVGDGVEANGPHLQPGKGLRQRAARSSRRRSARCRERTGRCRRREHFDGPIAASTLAVPGLLH